MSVLGFFVLLIVAAVCGSVGAAIAGYSRRGCLANIAIGLIGALIGSWLAGQLRAPLFLVVAGIPVLWAVGGAALFMAVIGALSGKR
ncbi:MAG: GlsB/YeaQ/YmgE family stress response membrane protein [Candidatus Oleimicrobiaceae bacterium]